jgi:hypothetical protein
MKAMSTIVEVKEMRPYTTKELARIYGVCDRTLQKWMKPHSAAIGPRQGRYFTVAQVEVIFEKLGLPYKLES